MLTQTINVATLPEDASDVWKMLVSAPQILPIGLTVISLAVLIWAIWWPSPKNGGIKMKLPPNHNLGSVDKGDSQTA